MASIAPTSVNTSKRWNQVWSNRDLRAVAQSQKFQKRQRQTKAKLRRQRYGDDTDSQTSLGSCIQGREESESSGSRSEAGSGVGTSNFWNEDGEQSLDKMWGRKKCQA